MSMIDARGPGDNTQTIDFAREETERLLRDYGYIKKSVEELRAESAAIEVVDDPSSKAKVVSLIKRMRDEAKRVLGIHELEKMPHFRRGQATDQFFFAMADLLAKRDRKARNGEADRLNDLLTDYDARVLAAEQERRRAEAEKAAAAARAAEEAREKAEREAREKALAAERARLEETRAAKTEVAQQAAETASTARVEETVTAQQAEKAHVETLRTPAEIMRTRTDDGTLATMGHEKFADITDRKTLALEPLRAYIPIAALETALRKYAEANGYSGDESVQIAGARFGKRPKSLVR